MLNHFITSLSSILRNPSSQPSRWRSHPLAHGALQGFVADMDQQGHGLVVWENRGELWTAPLETARGSAWAAFPVAPGRWPALAVNEHGKGMLAWMTGPMGEAQLLASLVESKDSVGSSHHRLDASGAVQHLQVAVDRRGGAIALWSQCGPMGWEVRVQAYDGRSKSWESASLRLGEPGPAPIHPHLVMNRQGLAIVIWQIREEDFEGLAAAYHWPHDHIWSDHPIRIASCSASELAATLDSHGNALVCWIQRLQGEVSILQASHFSESSCEWAHPCRLATAPGLFQLRMGSDSQGDSLLTWRQKESCGNDHLFGRIFRTAGWEDVSLHINPGTEPLRDYAVLKTATQTAILMLPLKGGAVLHWMEGSVRHPPVSLGQERMEGVRRPLLLAHPEGLTAFWLSGLQEDTQLMIARAS